MYSAGSDLWSRLLLEKKKQKNNVKEKEGEEKYVFNQCMATRNGSMKQIWVDKWFNQIVCSSKQNNTKKTLLSITRQSIHVTYNLNNSAPFKS